MSVSRTAASIVQSPVQAIEPRAIRFETQHYIVRTLEPADVTERACAWFADPGKASMINAAARALSPAEFTVYITSHDRVTGHALGIFDRATGLHIGLWAIYIDWERREFLVNVIVGERGYDPGARHETQRKLTSVFFEDMDLETVRFSVLSRNQRMEGRLDGAGIAPEHTSFSPSVVGRAFEEIHHYSVTREVWRTFADSRERRDLIKALTEAARAGI